MFQSPIHMRLSAMRQVRLLLMIMRDLFRRIFIFFVASHILKQ